MASAADDIVVNATTFKRWYLRQKQKQAHYLGRQTFLVWRLGGASRPKLVDKIVLDAGI
jgi:hypothetical protein